MSFDAGSEAGAYCDTCSESIYDGEFTYCQSCAVKGAGDDVNVWARDRQNMISVVTDYRDGEELRRSPEFVEAINDLIEWLDRPLSIMPHRGSAGYRNA